MPRWIAGPGMRILTYGIVERMIGSGILVKGDMLCDEAQHPPAENYREIAERSPPGSRATYSRQI